MKKDMNLDKNNGIENAKKALILLENIENLFLKILEKIGLKKISNLYKNHKQGMRYLIFGGLATFINIIVFAICSYLIFLKLPDEQRVNISNLIAILVAVSFAYICNKVFVFQSKTNNIKETVKEIGSFAGCRVITGVVDMGLINLLIVVLGFNEMLMKVAVQIIIVILNFVFSKLIIFKKKSNIA